MTTNAPEFEVDDAVVLLLGSAKGDFKIRGITRLEKLVFLLERETAAGKQMTESPDFEAYNYGPFSKKVYQAVDTLVAAGLLRDSANLSPTADESSEEYELIGDGPALTPYSTRDVELTPLGAEYYSALTKELSLEVVQGASDLRKRFDDWPLRALVRYVYQHYPDYAENSLIRDDILGKR